MGCRNKSKLQLSALEGAVVRTTSESLYFELSVLGMKLEFTHARNSVTKFKTC